MKLVKIGNQEWTAENCVLKSFSNGEPLSNAQTPTEWIAHSKKRVPAYCNVDFNPENECHYGLLYNWHVLADKRPLIEGFRCPNNTDWKLFLNEIIGCSVDDLDRDTQWALITEAGVKVKTETLWASFGVKSNGTNILGFNAAPAGGISSEGKFSHKGVSCSFWSLNNDPKFRWHFNIDDRNSMKLYGIPKRNWGHGLCLRLIKS